MQIAGGTSLFAQLRDRLERDMAELAPQVAKVKVMLPANSTERRFSVWIGRFLVVCRVFQALLNSVITRHPPHKSHAQRACATVKSEVIEKIRKSIYL